MSISSVAILPARHDHGRRFQAALAAGMARHGVRQATPETADLLVIWGHNDRAVIESGRHYLVMEAGYVGDRLEWCSLGFDGLNGRARFPVPDDGGLRWRTHFGDLLRPWNRPGDGAYALVMGQVRGDAALRGVDIAAWCAEAAANVAAEWGLPVTYRPHPKDTDLPAPPGSRRLEGDLAAALAGAAVVATFNSNSGVDAVLAGVPTIARDEGSMAWDVAAYDWDHAARPDRAGWAARLAWCQWTADEIASGDAWEQMKTARASA